MDEKLEKAFAVANYVATLSNQRRILAEEFSQRLIYYSNGGTFKVDRDLINFTKIVLDIGHTVDVPFIDANNLPVIIPDVQTFFDEIVSVYFEALNEYSVKYAEIKSKRKIQDIVDL